MCRCSSTEASVQDTSEGQVIDLIWGVGDIAKAIRRTERQAAWMLTNGALRGAQKINGRWVITRSALRAVFDVAA